MPDPQNGMALEDLLDGDDLVLLKEEAARRGITPEQLAKFGMQQELTKRTRPKAMNGTIQAFRRRE
ncbi:hypothetical protein [Pseudomonas sp. Hg5Tf]|uniref:Uncharacterized protein n=1 Tax=Pseudomonas sp. Hg7Tf TaxID=3236988 RepID=A0AB39HQJ2_9PSED|nr:hypothetical protein [Pseudomonas sp. Hg5Tf]MDH2559023.1 hypothetical protein [Pseudomonas sp. Hg5Tf]